MIDENGATAYTYDSTGNRISRTEAKADGAKELTTYDYNRASQLLSSTTTSEGQVVAWAQYLYDQNGRLEEETRWGERPEEGGAPQGLAVGRDTGAG